MVTINQESLLYLWEYLIAALFLGICTWKHLRRFDVTKPIGRRVFLFRLIPVIIVTLFGVALMAGIHLMRLEPGTRLLTVGAVQVFMTVFNSVLLGASIFQRYRIYPRGTALAAVLILMYVLADFFMPREIKYAVLAAAIIGGILLPDKWGTK